MWDWADGFGIVPFNIVKHSGQEPNASLSWQILHIKKYHQALMNPIMAACFQSQTGYGIA